MYFVLAKGMVMDREKDRSPRALIHWKTSGRDIGKLKYKETTRDIFEKCDRPKKQNFYLRNILHHLLTRAIISTNFTVNL